MASQQEFLTPAETRSVETEVKKSKFIATITAVASKEEFVSFYQAIKANYPHANHNCFAYIIGSPESPADIGSSDDGEPSGTAGMPILAILQHNNLGNVAVVITRFFGGIKLGTGGLVRAYSAATKTAVEKACLQTFVQTTRLQVSFPFQYESSVRYLLSENQIEIVDSAYAENVILAFNLPINLLDEFRHQLNDITKGNIEMR